jgi:hypothetical protein
MLIPIVLCVLASSLSAAADPFVGIWKLNITGLSSPNAPSFFRTIQIESAGTGLKSTASGADSEGFANGFTFTCKLMELRAR